MYRSVFSVEDVFTHTFKINKISFDQGAQTFTFDYTLAVVYRLSMTA